jgi:beta-phosphoglucomutase-like phosphatase (HAD superfamily)
MTGSSLQQIIARTRHLLLDFDGPVCAVFAGTPAPQVAKQLRDSLAAAGFTLPDDAEGQDDPLEVFRAIAQGSTTPPMLAQHVLTALEVRAVKTAQPTRGSADLITAYRTGRTVTIVSNNSGAAINAYLANHRLADYIKAVVARDDHDPERMKPSPYRVREAVGMLGRPGRRHRQLAIDQPGSPGSASGCWAARLLGAPIVQLAATASRALPAVASHAIGFAEPRPNAHSPGSGAYRGRRGEAGRPRRRQVTGHVPTTRDGRCQRPGAGRRRRPGAGPEVQHRSRHSSQIRALWPNLPPCASGSPPVGRPPCSSQRR